MMETLKKLTRWKTGSWESAGDRDPGCDPRWCTGRSTCRWNTPETARWRLRTLETSLKRRNLYRADKNCRCCFPLVGYVWRWNDISPGFCSGIGFSAFFWNRIHSLESDQNGSFPLGGCLFFSWGKSSTHPKKLEQEYCHHIDKRTLLSIFIDFCWLLRKTF